MIRDPKKGIYGTLRYPVMCWHDGPPLPDPYDASGEKFVRSTCVLKNRHTGPHYHVPDSRLDWDPEMAIVGLRDRRTPPPPAEAVAEETQAEPPTTEYEPPAAEAGA